jgi:hypothetical protein
MNTDTFVPRSRGVGVDWICIWIKKPGEKNALSTTTLY